MEKHIYDLLSKYFENLSDEGEIEKIEQWCNQSDENKKELVRLKKIWVLSDKKSSNQIDNAKPHIWEGILHSISDIKPQLYTKRKLMFYCSVAAAIAVLFTVGIQFAFNKREIQYTSLYMPKGEKGQLFLADGTTVWLNANSKITFDNEFNIKNRRVKLEGQAYFDVTQKGGQNFIVEAQSVDVVVYGTAFDVTAYNDTQDLSVTLQRGRVSLFKTNTNELISDLKPNQKISIDKYSFAPNITDFDAINNLTWTFDELVFEYTSVEEMYAKMENWYGVDIKISTPPKGVKYRFNVKSESLTEILQLIDKITPIDYKVNGKEVTVTYK